MFSFMHTCEYTYVYLHIREIITHQKNIYIYLNMAGEIGVYLHISPLHVTNRQYYKQSSMWRGLEVIGPMTLSFGVFPTHLVILVIADKI